jgi:hypothetical protein
MNKKEDGFGFGQRNPCAKTEFENEYIQETIYFGGGTPSV